MLIQSERRWRLFDFLAFTCGEKLMANTTGRLCCSASAPRRHTSPIFPQIVKTEQVRGQIIRRSTTFQIHRCCRQTAGTIAEGSRTVSPASQLFIQERSEVQSVRRHAGERAGEER